MPDSCDAPAPRQRQRGLLYGRRRGKSLRPERARSYEAGMARHRLSLDVPCADPLGLFDAPVTRLALEIGFGGGEHLLHQLGRQGDTGFIGCEPFLNGMARLLDDGQNHAGAGRLKVHEGDAREVLAWLPDGALDIVYLLYPDPWPKLKHEKRRFMAPDTLGLLHPKMKRGAELRVASDIDVYKAGTLKAVAAHGGFASSGRDTSGPWEDWICTRYEAKALREGRVPAYFSFFASLLPD